MFVKHPGGPHETPAHWGGYAGYSQDPDGHLWEVVWNPAIPAAGLSPCLTPFHSGPGATLPGLVLPLFLAAHQGVYSHLVLDSFMRADLHPLAPFSAASWSIW